MKKTREIMMHLFDYEKPELVDFNSVGVRGEGEEPSCFNDCTSDAVCPGSDDEI